jgi:hypothetical protein
MKSSIFNVEPKSIEDGSSNDGFLSGRSKKLGTMSVGRRDTMDGIMRYDNALKYRDVKVQSKINNDLY